MKAEMKKNISFELKNDLSFAALTSIIMSFITYSSLTIPTDGVKQVFPNKVDLKLLLRAINNGVPVTQWVRQINQISDGICMIDYEETQLLLTAIKQNRGPNHVIKRT